MIKKVELGSVNSIKKTPRYYNNNISKSSDVQFTGLVDGLLLGIQKCEENPMLNVTVLDLTTAIGPRSISETVIGSKQKDDKGNETKRKFNFLAGFEALRRESSGLIINCLIPSFIVIGAAKILNRPIMQNFKFSNLTQSWANSDTINKIQQYYTSGDLSAKNKHARMYEALRKMILDIEGVDGNIRENGLISFKDKLENDKIFNRFIERTVKNIESINKKGDFTKYLYKYIVKKTGVSENIRFKGDNGYFSSNLEHLCSSFGEMMHGVVLEKDNIKSENDLLDYFKKAKHLVNAKSILGLGIIIPLALMAQPINRWITHKISGKQGAPIYNDDQERILTPAEKIKLATQKCFAIPLMASVAGLSMFLDKPCLRMFQFKGLFPTMDQARIISATTFSSRIAASEDSNELKENTIRDIATFSSFYFLGDYAAKAIATLLERTNKSGIKLLNILKPLDKDVNVFKKLWHWAKQTKMKSTDELEAIADKSVRYQAKKLRAFCQLGNIAFSLLSLGLFIPLYTRTQTNKKKKKLEMELKQKLANEAFKTKLYSNNGPTFKAFLNNNK